MTKAFAAKADRRKKGNNIMKKIIKIAVSILLACALLAALSSCGGDGEVTDGDGMIGDEEKETRLTVWCAENLVELTKKQLEEYNEENGTNVKFTVNPVGEGDAATNLLTDVTAGADVYCFSQDQLARLVQAGALAPVSDALRDKVRSEHDEGSVAAAEIGGTLYAFPLTSDNGYFMYYDKRVISDPAVLADQTKLIEAVSAAGKTIAFELLGSHWYGSSYFLGAGAESVWETGEDGAFTSYNDTFGSDKGIIAAKGMAELVASPVFVDSSSASSFTSGAAVVVAGTWEYETAKQILGENLGCAPLWSYTVDGESYHLGSFSGNKLVGVKPQGDSKRAALCQSVAYFLSDKDRQEERFEALGWGPSNREVQMSEDVMSNEALTALAAQNKHATLQGQYPNAWWDTGKAIGAALKQLGKTAPTTEEVRPILDTYTKGLEEIIK